MKSGIDISHAQTVTPIVSQNWMSMGLKQQMEICQALLDQHNCDMDVINTKPRAEVIVKFRKSLNAAERGTALLDAENILKSCDSAITIYLEAKDDKNPLRKFRGVVINDDRR